MTASCQNCRHRREVERAAHVFCAVYESRCAKFVTTTYDRIAGAQTKMLTCADAMENFCGLGDWQPTVWHRISRAFGRTT